MSHQPIVAVDNSESNFPDTFSLIMNYSDPFIKIPKKSANTVSKQSSKKLSVEYEDTDPEIAYKGMILNPKGKVKTGFFKFGIRGLWFGRTENN